MALVVIGLMHYLPENSPKTYLYINVLLRLIQGYGESLSVAVSVALVPIVWGVDERDRQLANINTTFTFGMIVGAPLSALIYSYVGYLWTFCIFAFACIFGTFVCAMVLPDELNEDDDPERDNQISHDLEIIELINDK